MNDDALRTADTVLDAVLDLPPAERDAYLDTHVAPELRAYVDRLLVASEALDPLLDAAPVSVVEVQTAAGDQTGLGERVGPYRIAGLLGEGGMGRVYRAERTDGAFERTVALKLVRRSLALAGADVAERLRRERDVLASLEHPNIARLYGGGETPDGVPWVAMELVDGEPITAYARARALSVSARVALAVDVCRAVEHAHRRLVVHRDIKPSNVFVAEDETGAPVVKLLDFGIARLLDVDADGLTQTGAPVLTPDYAAPEQVAGGEITTATDVWALGVLTYELLVGRRPFAPRGSRSGVGALRAIEQAHRQPVAAPSASAEHAGARRQLRGDLDAVVLQALRTEPERRYASAGTLGDDLERALSGLPVVARRASWGYVAGAFARRHRGAVASAAAVAVALVVGLGATLVSLSRERDARAEAEAEAARADGALTFVVDLFGGSDGAPLDPNTTTADLLAAGRRRAAALGPDRAPERAVAFRALRQVYGRLYQTAPTREAAAEAIRTAREAYGPGHPFTLAVLGEHAVWSADVDGPDAARPYADATLRGYRALGAAGRLPLARFQARYGSTLAWVSYNESGQWTDAAEALLDEAEPVLRAAADSVALLAVLNGRAHAVETRRGINAAAPLYESYYRMALAVYGESDRAMGAMNNWADTLLLLGDADAATPVFDSLVVYAQRTYGPRHADLGFYRLNAARAHLERDRPGDVDRALVLTAQADRIDPDANPFLLFAASMRVRALLAAGRWAAVDARAEAGVRSVAASSDTSAGTWAEAAQMQADRATAQVALGRDASALATAALSHADDEGAATAHIALACVASRRGDARAARASVQRARRRLADAPPHYRTPRLVAAAAQRGPCSAIVDPLPPRRAP